MANADLLRNAGVLVRAFKLLEPNVLQTELLVLDDNVVTIEFDDGAIVLGEKHVGGISGTALFHASADVGPAANDAPGRVLS